MTMMTIDVVDDEDDCDSDGDYDDESPYLFQKGASRHFGFHFQQRIFAFTFSKGWNWTDFWISLSKKLELDRI